MSEVEAGRLRATGSAADCEVGGEQGFVVDFDEDRVIAGLGKREIADLVDQIDAMQGALGNERPLDERLQSSGVETERDADLVLARGTVAQREKPNHERMGDRKLPRGDVGENAEQRVFA